MLEDNLFPTKKWLSDSTNQDTLVKFLKASFQGWIYCRDHQAACVNIVLKNGSLLGKGHQTWQLNEINKLIWPAASGAGLIDQKAWNQTVQISQQTKNQDGKTVLTKAPDASAYSNDYVTKALADLKANGVDVTGTSFKPITVQLQEGGA